MKHMVFNGNGNRCAVFYFNIILLIYNHKKKKKYCNCVSIRIQYHVMSAFKCFSFYFFFTLIKNNVLHEKNLYRSYSVLQYILF